VPGSRLAERYAPIIRVREAFISFQTAAEVRYGALRRGSGAARMLNSSSTPRSIGSRSFTPAPSSYSSTPNSAPTAMPPAMRSPSARTTPTAGSPRPHYASGSRSSPTTESSAASPTSRSSRLRTPDRRFDAIAPTGRAVKHSTNDLTTPAGSDFPLGRCPSTRFQATSSQRWQRSPLGALLRCWEPNRLRPRVRALLPVPDHQADHPAHAPPLRGRLGYVAGWGFSGGGRVAEAVTGHIIRGACWSTRGWVDVSDQIPPSFR
jgi:hypothetical protein